MERSLADLLHSALPGTPARGDVGMSISAITYDSRRVQPGTLFCCLRGGAVDGHDFAEQAVAAGAEALLVDHPLQLAVTQVVVPDTRSAMGHLSAALYDHPARSMSVVGVTGTNGKTTTTHLIASVLRAAGQRCGVIGTLTGKHTTPEAPELQALLAGFRDDECTSVAMEVSSHALALHRVDGCRFAVAVFTNLGRDHLDLHRTMEDYFAAKRSLFEPTLSALAVINIDDEYGQRIVASTDVPVVAYSVADATDVEVSPTAHEYTWRGVRIRVALGGAFNVLNSLAAATACAALGLAPQQIADGVATAPPVPGRFEAVHAGQPFDVVVDYAHTPDGLRAVLTAARPAAPRRLLVVFGCGGDRDVDKRPQMGAVAAELADQVVITSDNPRSEDPLGIINAISAGVPDDYRARVVTVPDRRHAFATAFRSAAAGDVVVIAGKGHETTQTIGTEVLPFDDRVVAREELEALA